MATPQDKLWFAVRKTEGKEWIDVSSWGYLPETPRIKTKETDEQIPHWAKDNPVIRYSQFSLVEIVD